MGGFREAIIVLIALAIGYGFFLAWKIFSIPREENTKNTNNDFYEPRLNEEDEQAASKERSTVSPRPKRHNYAYEPPESVVQSATLLVRLEALEKQLVDVRQNMLEMRTNLAHLTQNTAQELERLRSMQTVSPMYSEAMRLAGSGYGARDIAQRCGITLAEAELVSALARNQEEAYGE